MTTKKKSKTQNIEVLRKQFKHEWLLIKIDKMDESTTTPLTGHLLAHSPSRDEVYKIANHHKGHLMTLYSDDWPEHLGAIFTIYVDL